MLDSDLGLMNVKAEFWNSAYFKINNLFFSYTLKKCLFFNNI